MGEEKGKTFVEDLVGKTCPHCGMNVEEEIDELAESCDTWMGAEFLEEGDVIVWKGELRMVLHVNKNEKRKEMEVTLEVPDGGEMVLIPMCDEVPMYEV